jgi:hypothetical protein
MTAMTARGMSETGSFFMVARSASFVVEGCGAPIQNSIRLPAVTNGEGSTLSTRRVFEAVILRML